MVREKEEIDKEIDTDFKKLQNDYQDDDEEEDEELNKMSTDLLMRTQFPHQQDSVDPNRPKTQKEIMMEVRQ